MINNNSMSILHDNKLPQAEELTPEQLEQRKQARLNYKVNTILNVARETYNNLVNVQRNGIDMLWYDDLLTPQEICDGLGENVIKVFEFHGALTQFVQTLADNAQIEVDLKYPTNSFTELSGNIVISDQPYEV